MRIAIVLYNQALSMLFRRFIKSSLLCSLVIVTIKTNKWETKTNPNELLDKQIDLMTRVTLRETSM
jgi:hypothetical protein